MPDQIKHVILLMLENHSFDQMLGSLKSANADIDGVDAAHPGSNKDVTGNIYSQRETDEVQTSFDPKHEFVNVQRQLANGNSGFALDFSQTYPSSTVEDRQEIMGYYSLGKLTALHALAKDFLICDRWFSSLPGPTWPNRFFALSGTSNGEIEMPSGIQEVEPGWYFHQTQTTIFDRLNEKQKSWKVYFYDFPNSWLLLHQLEPENLARYHDINHFFRDVGDEGSFPEFVFIEPKYFGQDQNDDHPPHNVMKAEKLVADVYNAIRSNPALWNSSLLVVNFDEHGGFYDHVVPPPAVPPDDKTQKYAFNQFGVRVPSLLISPWVRRGVTHTVFDHTSLLKYLIDKWGLGPLGNRAAKANSFAAEISEPSARTDTVPFIRVPYGTLIPPRPELEQEDDNDHQEAIRAFSRALEMSTGDPRFKQPQAEPGAFLNLKVAVGRALIGLGNRLTRDYEKLQDDKLNRLTSLVKDVATGKLAVTLPKNKSAASGR